MGFIFEEEHFLIRMFNRVRKKDYSGNVGIVLKNSVYQFLTTAVSKIGALIVTVILARMLMPEMFGLYTLSVSTILIFATFSDLGIGDAAVRFISKEAGKNNRKKAGEYFRYLLKMKLFLIFLMSFLLLILAKFIAGNFYNKPMFLALLAGSLYIFFSGLASFFQSVLQATNNFRIILYKEILFQSVRLILIPLFILFLLPHISDSDLILSYLVSILSVAFLFSFVLMFFFFKKNVKYLRVKGSLSKKQKHILLKFVTAISATVFSGVFFSYIDTIMLGVYLSSEFIGYYRAASIFIVSGAPLITFSAAFLPIFSRLKDKSLEYLFNKSVTTTLLFSLLGVVFVVIFSPLLISLVFGADYSSSVNILRIFSLLLISIPVISLYSAYFSSRGLPLVVTKTLVISTFLNIFLNYILISTLVNYNPLWAVYGATFATIFSNWFYMFTLIHSRKKFI